MLSRRELEFANSQRVGHLATADRQGVPHVVPVCFAIRGASLYIAIDEKPKAGHPRRLKRLRNIAENPAVSVVIDRYDEDWSQLGWVRINGRADILEHGDEVAQALALLRKRYPQYRTMTLEGLPVIAVRIEKVGGWGSIRGHDAGQEDARPGKDPG